MVSLGENFARVRQDREPGIFIGNFQNGGQIYKKT